ncbi:DUF2059 domain-containing protein [Flavobacterium litorale]|uniref:DUF2059 domain-containing protein n=1 Tax=Flavobacterium litorale TaxID=2856519 RepID=A0ABX8VBY3_9FLAO|nr:DUF2059 domain-containing protein [Flavobacterium litorale]QYJ68541.1 DUF2059 domain-containing protein [Flavobacterium litorale]
MKKLVFAFVFMLAAQFTFAQDAAFKADVKKMMELTGATAQMDMAKKQVMAMVPADKQADFTKEFEKSLEPVLESQTNFYMKEFTHQEIKDLIKFYQSPLGRKLAEKSTKLAEENIQTMQEWSMELQGIMMKYMQ